MKKNKTPYSQFNTFKLISVQIKYDEKESILWWKHLRGNLHVVRLVTSSPQMYASVMKYFFTPA